MSYCIEYNPELGKKYPKVKFKRHLPIKKLVYLLAFFLASYMLIHNKLYQYFIPGNPEATVAAFSTMVERVGEGDSMKDAVFGFCHEILLNGNK